MVLGIPITHDIIKAAITELYMRKDMNAIDTLRFYKKYGVIFTNREEVKIEAMKMGYRFKNNIPHKATQKQRIIADFNNEQIIYTQA